MNQPGKVALVTAGARRLGQAACLKFAELGYDIALHYKSSAAEAEATATQVKKIGRRCQLFQADLLQTNQSEILVDQVMEKLGALSLLVNNASIWTPASFAQSSTQVLLDNLNIHIVAPYILCREFSRKAGQGQIINVTDASTCRNKTDFFPYLLSKKTLQALTEMLAVELAPHFRVNAVAPGMLLPSEGLAATVFPRELEENLLKRCGKLSDYTEALEYLSKSEHITGQCLFVAAGDQLNAWQ
ncbi:MAG: SDR family NAD(P)-dependent oxidoreductase [Candidatus Obscuribacterales bacterium]|nr:SDR family NAD(P)-dependent oxidoreductase [Candidatus Obscuribacterales bacterium]